MLIEFYGKNFGCFRDEFRLSMLATDIDPGSDRGIAEVKVEGDDEPLRLLRAVALYGPNASGKSTLLRAARTLVNLLRLTAHLPSDSPLKGYEPFALGPQRAAPVELGAKALIAGRVYDYSIAFDREAVLAENLVRLLPDGKPKTLVGRHRQDVRGTWTKDAQFRLVSSEFRSNALLLALADSLTPRLARDIAVGFRGLLQYSDPFASASSPAGPSTALRAHDDKEFRAWLRAQLRTADVGVVDVRPHETKYRLLKPTPGPGQAPRGKKALNWEESLVTFRLSLLHESESGPMALPYRSESLGTQRVVEWAPLIYDLTRADRPAAVFVDELDASMHPLLLRAIVNYVNRKAPAHAARGQLIFTTHETSLLDDEAKDAVLRRDQIYLTEKDAGGASRLYSVAEFRERNNLNIRRRYLQGRYGALPALGLFSE